ncbi:hypothetical protein NC796_17225 [Aliifodinibius sp. S!AR15-10]|uniref:hypothetical protein n=1 Tax=Aliifodinibius sp. S!AR15-10 TaxID=2950437 RepID=UPI00285822CE|nr:hypothetical protein [Aliifodinibius sp. S!AR15-10]MDR8392901.1 hypothetical protein [Aliifodinibius sp. S!AR15-10]
MKSRHIITGLATLLLSFSLIACGGNSKQETQSSDESSSTAEQTISQAAPSQKLNLNTASEEDFLAIPGVGDNMVHEFEEYRPYVSISQFRKEIGKYVDQDQVAAYEEYVFVPIDPNECDAATLQQIPGLEASEADELISARPFESNDAFLQQLSEFVTEEEQATAEQYLASE